MLIQLDERQANILLTIMSYVTANGKQVPLKTITETLNAMAGVVQQDNAPISMEALNSFSSIFGELQINNVSIPVRDVIAINNALQEDKSRDYEKVPDLIKQAEAGELNKDEAPESVK